MAVKFNPDELNQLVGVLSNTPDEIRNKYIAPCKTTLKECGLEASLQASVDEAADEMVANFTHDLGQFEVIRDNILSFSEDLKVAYEAAQAKLRALKDAAGNTTKVQTEQRTRKAAF